MVEAVKPPVSKQRLTQQQRVQVLELRRSNSITEVARLTGLPPGTVKTVCSRAGATRDNMAARAFFTLPPLALVSTTAVTAPAVLPEQRAVTGDADVDAVLWLREVVATGDGDLIAKALEAAQRIQTPAKELERRYADYLVRSTGNTLAAAFGSMNFADLSGHARSVIDRQARQREAVSRWGSEAAMWADQATEQFCIDALIDLEPGGMFREYDSDAAVKAFEAEAAMRPHTLADCLHELDYWSALYRQRSAWPDAGDGLPQTRARESYLHRCLSVLRPKSRDEAKAVLRHIANERDCLNDDVVDAILENLIG